MADAIKFIHASDFHLDQPISGLAELPKHLIPALANAPYEAAQKVFDTAISERVDFVLLSGDLYDQEQGSARAPAFLLSNFQRLADKNIHVYWCAGKCDQPDRWPSSIELPETVVTFSSHVVEEVEHYRDGELVATILGAGYDPRRHTMEDFSTAVTEVPSVAMLYSEVDTSKLVSRNIKYWALGGRHKMAKLDNNGSVIAYSGSPQGRTPKESGVHGFKFCRIDTTGKIRVTTVEADRVRWLPQKVAIDENVRMSELKEALAERALKIISDTTDQVVLARWFLATGGEFNPRIRQRKWAGEILDWLRDEFGRGDKGLWSTRVDVEAPKSMPMDWYEEDTILGEYMRAVGRYQSDDSLKLNLHEYMPQTVQGDLMSSVGHVSKEQREKILRKAALIGIEYLASHKVVAEMELEGELNNAGEMKNAGEAA